MITQKKEKLLIENLLASKDVFSRCIGIINPKYFDSPEYRPAVTFMTEYFQSYNNLPTIDTINAEFDLGFETRVLTSDQYNYTCDEIEKFCKQSAVIKAIQETYNEIENNDFDKIYKKISDALSISLQKEMGVELYEDPEEYLRKLLETEINHSTGIASLDGPLNGGLARTTFTLFSANSGVGKSNMLANLGVNYSLQGFNVLYISLELPEDMIYLRLAAISTKSNINLWKTRIPEISAKLVTRKTNGAGSYKIKRLPGNSTTNAIRSYLKQYELEYGCTPDVVIIDYLDLMHPNGGIKNKTISDQDKEKSEEINELIFELNAIGISASQQNREALRLASPDQAVIAGGLTKVNTVHNYISLSMPNESAIRGEMFAHFLKTRSSSAKGKTMLLHFDANTLVISDPINGIREVAPTIVEKSKYTDKNKVPSASNKKVVDIIGVIKEVEEDNSPVISDKERFINAINNEPEIDTSSFNDETFDSVEPNESTDNGNNLLDLMNSFGNYDMTRGHV